MSGTAKAVVALLILLASSLAVYAQTSPRRYRCYENVLFWGLICYDEKGRASKAQTTEDTPPQADATVKPEPETPKKKIQLPLVGTGIFR
jgi:hypothetical protein